MPSGPGSLLVDIAETSDVAALMTAATDTLRAWVGVGPVFLATADPVTAAFAGTHTFDIPDAAAAAFFEIETAGQDVLRFRDLARAREPVDSLVAATHGSPEASVRWREVLAPLGWGDELRAAVRAHGAVWGYVCLHREQAERRFTVKEIARVNALLPALAEAMRRTALVSVADRAELNSGVVIADERLRVIGATGAAAAWLDEFGTVQPGGLPLLLGGLVRLVLDSGRPATATLTTDTGRVGVVEAALLESAAERQVAVVISAAPPGYRMARLAAATGLTAREQQIVACVLRGLPTRGIADELCISPHTVQAHLTSVFAKTGLRSRRELIARLRT